MLLTGPPLRSSHVRDGCHPRPAGAPPLELRTERLLLRPWRPDDRAPFAALNADPEVMACFPAPLSRKESDDLADRCDRHVHTQGWGLWAVEVVGGEPFIGFVGLDQPRFAAHFMPCVEIGWRLARPAWGHGYATEGATEALRVAFEVLGLDEVVSSPPRSTCGPARSCNGSA